MSRWLVSSLIIQIFLSQSLNMILQIVIIVTLKSVLTCIFRTFVIWFKNYWVSHAWTGRLLWYETILLIMGSSCSSIAKWAHTYIIPLCTAYIYCNVIIVITLNTFPPLSFWVKQMFSFFTVHLLHWVMPQLLL